MATGNRRYRRGVDRLESAVDELLADGRDDPGREDLLSVLVAAGAGDTD